MRRPPAVPLEQVFEAVMDGVIVTDRRFRVTYMNTAAEGLLGRFAEESVGRPLTLVLEDGGETAQTITLAVREGRSLAIREIDWPALSGACPERSRGVEGPHHRAPLPLDIHANPLWDRPGEVSGAVLVLRDLRLVKQLEDEKRLADRLAMMGTIATGLAHEIKNPLAGINGAAQLLARRAQLTSDREMIDIILKESERVSRLLANLLSFARPRPKSLKPVNINRLLDRVSKLFANFFEKKKLALVLNLDPSLPPVRADESGLIQVFENLVTNGLEAMGAGGILTLSTRFVSEYHVREGKRGGRFIEVEVTDTGPGMDATVLERVFTPFFTTKEKGTGLGLAMAQRIVAENGGKMKIRSQKGRGTTVVVSLKGVCQP